MPSGNPPLGGTDGVTPTSTTGDSVSGTISSAPSLFTGAANAFANRQGTIASVAMAVVLGLFVTCL